MCKIGETNVGKMNLRWDEQVETNTVYSPTNYSSKNIMSTLQQNKWSLNKTVINKHTRLFSLVFGTLLFLWFTYDRHVTYLLGPSAYETKYKYVTGILTVYPEITDLITVNCQRAAAHIWPQL